MTLLQLAFQRDNDLSFQVEKSKKNRVVKKKKKKKGTLLILHPTFEV